MIKTFIDNLLGFLETRESRLLSWGFYDSGMTLGDITTLLESEGSAQLLAEWEGLQQSGHSLDDIVEVMEQANLLFMARRQPCLYRTRFAEGIRLIARLKQLFRESQWATAPNLVSDIKINLSPRRYPRRDQTREMCWEPLRDSCQARDLQRELFDALSRDAHGGDITFAGFQSRAFHHILSTYNAPGVSGSIVCAGTGSGKTKAFYIPALLACSSELHLPAFTKVIAIYPRNVLLADQLREAMAEAEKLRPILARRGLRPLQFGALLGSTPRDSARSKPESLAGPHFRWQRRSNAYAIPYLKSPFAPEQELLWREADIRAGSSRLFRADGSQTDPDIAEGTLAITREDIMRNPPDVLFLSLEMLNRELGNPEWSRTFGIDVGTSPRLLLLDEIHSYEGVHGAQIAWVLRRWRHAARPASLHVVGLSATLKEASSHLSKVAGIRPDQVHEFRPRSEEIIAEGMEYNVAIKGASAAGTTLLSTTLQTGMLLARLLTPRSQPRTPADLPIAPEALFGRTVFGFTDNLDGVNRWLSDMTDAERRRLPRLRLHPQFQQPQPNPLPDAAELWRRDQLGQLWELPRRLGHDLQQSLRIGRCSSQDPGADTSADMIIATSSLEVGYDDPRVGAIIQHKRPISTASFLQRKGRAGRMRGTRPWTVVILSDYGADRWAFQQAENLFEPELTTLQLPLHNPYVLRIQATYFLLDWLGRRVGASPFDFLRSNSVNRAAQQRAMPILLDLLEQGPAWKEFRRELERLFGRGMHSLSEQQIDSVLWDLPRPVLRHVVPNMLRKLESSWAIADPARQRAHEDENTSRPLPGFLPKATFAELEDAEVDLALTRQGQDDQLEQVGIEQALFEACPGRVSKRYSLSVGEPGFWAIASTQLPGGEVHLSIQDVFPVNLDLGTFGDVHVFQPLSASLAHRPPTILDSSFASWNWENVLRPYGRGLELPVFRSAPWSSAITDVAAFLHRDQSCIEVVRFARSAEYEIRRQQADPSRGRVVLGVREDVKSSPKAVGFRHMVDGIRLRMRADHLQAIPARSDALEAALRSDYYLDQVQASPVLGAITSVFMAAWMWQVSVAMLTATAATQRITLAEAQKLLRGKRVESAERVLRVIFQVQNGNGDDGRLVDELRHLWGDPKIVEEIERLESVLWSTSDADYSQWIRKRYAATWAQAFRAAATINQSDVCDDDLAVDVLWNLDGTADLYLTETQTGGLGQIETIVYQIRQDPHRFVDGFERMLTSCPRAQTVNVLCNTLGHVVEHHTHGDLAGSFSDIRQARDFQSFEVAKERLRRSMDDAGIPNTRHAVLSVATKILRPGSSSNTDHFSHVLNKMWHRLERRLCLAIDPRVFAYCAISRLPIQRRLSAYLSGLSGGIQPSISQMYFAAQEFLFEGCHTSCPECLHLPSRFNDFGTPARDLAQAWLKLSVDEIAWSEDSNLWMSHLRTVLQQRGKARLVVPVCQIRVVAAILPQFLTTPIEVEFLFVPTVIAGVEKTDASWKFSFLLQQVIHA